MTTDSTDTDPSKMPGGNLLDRATLRPHRFALEYPPMSDDEFQAFKADVEKLGQLDPITLFRGEILDGVCRHRAAVELGREPTFVEFVGTEAEAEAFVRAKNGRRRHLTIGQRAVIAARRVTTRHGGDRVSNGADAGYTIAQAAQTEGISATTVQRGYDVLTHGTPAEVEAVFLGTLSLADALERIRNSKRVTRIEWEQATPIVGGPCAIPPAIVHAPTPLVTKAPLPLAERVSPGGEIIKPTPGEIIKLPIPLAQSVWAQQQPAPSRDRSRTADEHATDLVNAMETLGLVCKTKLAVLVRGCATLDTVAHAARLARERRRDMDRLSKALARRIAADAKAKGAKAKAAKAKKEKVQP